MRFVKHRSTLIMHTSLHANAFFECERIDVCQRGTISRDGHSPCTLPSKWPVHYKRCFMHFHQWQIDNEVINRVKQYVPLNAIFSNAVAMDWAQMAKISLNCHPWHSTSGSVYGGLWTSHTWSSQCNRLFASIRKTYFVLIQRKKNETFESFKPKVNYWAIVFFSLSLCVCLPPLFHSWHDLKVILMLCFGFYFFVVVFFSLSLHKN